MKNLISKSGMAGSGIMLLLRRALCELRSCRPGAVRRRRLRAGENGYEPIVSAIVCTYNREDKLLAAVRSLLEQTGAEYEVIVVNNGKPFCNRVLNELSRVKIINEGRTGLSHARNAGAAAARGEYLTFIDDDAVAEPGLLECVRRTFEEHKKAAVIGGLILLGSKPPIVLPGYEALWSEFTVPYEKYREVSMQYEFPFGANFSVRHSVLDAMGGFDLRYGRTGSDYAGGEETALCFKALSCGYRIGIQPQAVVRHMVDDSRFTREHIRRTLRAGIFTTRRLYIDGYSPYNWDKSYAMRRIKLAEDEMARLRRGGADELEIYYKECERDGFCALVREIEKEAAQL